MMDIIARKVIPVIFSADENSKNISPGPPDIVDIIFIFELWYKMFLIFLCLQM